MRKYFREVFTNPSVYLFAGLVGYCLGNYFERQTDTRPTNVLIRVASSESPSFRNFEDRTDYRPKEKNSHEVLFSGNLVASGKSFPRKSYKVDSVRLSGTVTTE